MTNPECYWVRETESLTWKKMSEIISRRLILKTFIVLGGCGTWILKIAFSRRVSERKRYNAPRKGKKEKEKYIWLVFSIHSISRIAFYAGQNFIPTVMTSSGDDGEPMPAKLELIETFMGIHHHGDGTYSKVPERLPVGPDGLWYRRSSPLLVESFKKKKKKNFVFLFFS